MYIKFFSFLLFIGIWLGLNGFHVEGTGAFFLLAASLITFFFANKLSILPKKNVFKASALFYFLWLLKEIILSTISVIKIAWRRNLRIHPILAPIKTIQTNEIAVITYGNSITLTPGTVTLSIENDILLVHALDITFMDDLRGGDMDRRVKKIIK